jgi:Mrp family chromosome partitioning ATPase/capsular polysaccharide biosynthesis protein
MTTQPKELTLRGYFDIMRRQRWLILGVALICAAAAFGYSKVKTKTYSATASLSVNDPNQGLSLLGSSSFSGQTPLQESSAAAPQVTRPEVVAGVERQLGAKATSSAVSAAVDPNSYVINITATSHSATQAAATANAFASVDAALTTKEARRQYQQQAASVGQLLKHIKPSSTQGITTAATLARLQNLATFATPLNINTRAAVPGSPSSPKPLLYTVVALIFGLLLGIAVATGRDALDRRLRHSNDVSRVLNHPVIGHVRAKALGRSGAPLASSNGRAALEEPDRESFRILRQNMSYLGVAPERRIVLVTSSVGEEGKSTVAACLAVATAEQGKRTLLVECDLRKPVLARRFGIKETPGLTDYLTGNAEPQAVLQPVAGIVERLNGSAPTLTGGRPEGPNLVCITAGTSVHGPAELLASQRFHTFLAEVSEVYDTVILDTAPLLPVADTLGIVPAASSLIVCVRLEQTTREQARAAQSALDRLPERPVGLVLTDVRQPKDGNYYGTYGAPTPASA